MSYIKNPSSIEERSFQLIQAIIDQDHPDYQFQTEMEESIIKRAIHTSGDFDYLYQLSFQGQVVDKIQEVLLGRGHLIFDSTISLCGINKRVLDQMGVRYHCFIDLPEVRDKAESQGMTRAMAAVEYGLALEGPKVFAFGGAPTALYHLLDLLAAGHGQADAIIGVPVGFINVEESKEALLASGLPSLVSRGRKGGSTIVVAIINAILYQMRQVLTEDYVRYATPENK